MVFSGKITNFKFSRVVFFGHKKPPVLVPLDVGVVSDMKNRRVLHPFVPYKIQTHWQRLNIYSVHHQFHNFLLIHCSRKGLILSG